MPLIFWAKHAPSSVSERMFRVRRIRHVSLWSEVQVFAWFGGGTRQKEKGNVARPALHSSLPTPPYVTASPLTSFSRRLPLGRSANKRGPSGRKTTSTHSLPPFPTSTTGRRRRSWLSFIACATSSAGTETTKARKRRTFASKTPWYSTSTVFTALMSTLFSHGICSAVRSMPCRCLMMLQRAARQVHAMKRRAWAFHAVAYRMTDNQSDARKSCGPRGDAPHRQSGRRVRLAWGAARLHDIDIEVLPERVGLCWRRSQVPAARNSTQEKARCIIVTSMQRLSPLACANVNRLHICHL